MSELQGYVGIIKNMSELLRIWRNYQEYVGIFLQTIRFEFSPQISLVVQTDILVTLTS